MGTNKRDLRIGEKIKLKTGEYAQIIQYNSIKDISIQFDDGTIVHNIEYHNFKKGSIKNPNHPNVLGVANSGNEETSYIDENGRKMSYHSYTTWYNMIRRCYDKKAKERQPAYQGALCCDEWLYYPNFKRWYDENYYTLDNQRMDLEKDILFKGNKVYSPKTCIFVPHKINTLFTRRYMGNLPPGVKKHKDNRKFLSVIGKNGKDCFLGSFDTPEEAFNTYKLAKEKYIKEVAEEYKDRIPEKLYNAMYQYELENYKEN